MRVLLLVLLLGACAPANRRTFTVAAPADVAEAAAFAASAWQAADASLTIALTGDADATDVRITWGELPAPECARTDTGTGSMVLSRSMSDRCRGRLEAVIGHELGHWIAGRLDHVDQPGALMNADIRDAADEPTAADVAYEAP